MMKADTRSGVAPRPPSRAGFRARSLAVRLAMEALLIGGIAAAWAGLDIMLRDDQQARVFR